jgi:hypothetical protein
MWDTCYNVSMTHTVSARGARKYVPAIFVPGTTVKLLSENGKMPCLSWSLPAGEACPWKLGGPGSICGDCYAMKGSYQQYPFVLRAQRARFAWVRECLKTPEGTTTFVKILGDAIAKGSKGGYFRVHDSGDLFSPAYVWAWVRIVQSLPDIKFWFPTRSWRPLTSHKVSPATKLVWELALLALAAEPNVTVRPSALFFNAPAPRISGLQAGSTAVDGEGFSCPAPRQGNSCGDCRACWDKPEVAISYHHH